MRRPALHVQCQQSSCSRPAPMSRGLFAGSLTCAKRSVTVWKLPGVREERQLGGTRTFTTQAPCSGQLPNLPASQPTGGCSWLQ